MTAPPTVPQQLGGRTVNTLFWDFTTRNTYSPAHAGCGEWHVTLGEVVDFITAATTDQDYGTIAFGSSGQLGFTFRDNPGWSPFVIVRLRDYLEGVGLQIRYNLVHSDHQANWTDWQPIAWDAARRGYVHIGPTSDGSIGEADGWCHIEMTHADTDPFDLMDVRAGWAYLG